MRIAELAKKFIVTTVAAAMVLGYTPLAKSVDSFAAGETATGTDALGAGATVEEKTYSVTADSTVPAYTAYKNMATWRDRKSYKAPENTYDITIATGATSGEKVLYLAIKYKDKDKVSRTQFIFPALDATKRCSALLKYYSDKGNAVTRSFGKQIAEELNYTTADPSDKPLETWTVQDYAFQTEAPIYTLEGIDIYLESGTWNCRGLALYKVDEYKGYEEYGMISGETFLDFKGTLVAEASMTMEKTLSGSGQDKVFRVGGEHGAKEFKVINYLDKQNPPARNYSGQDQLYSFRFDFADVYEGGIEAFMNPSAKTVKDYKGIVEDMSLQIQYLDTHGWTRKVTLPIVLSSYGQVLRAVPNSTIFGFAQRGETIAFQGILPEFSQFVGTPVLAIGDTARNTLGDNVKCKSYTGTMSSNLSDTRNDRINLAGVSFYKGGCMPYIRDGVDSDGVALSGANIEYVFEGSPIQYYTTTQGEGRQIPSGASTKIEMSQFGPNSTLIAESSVMSTQYLITLDTSLIGNAGSDSDFTVQFHYKDFDGKANVTPRYKVKDSANNFMGQWQTTSGANFIEKSGLVAGGSISFLVDADNVLDFTGVELDMGGDSWTMKNLTISYVQSYQKRRAYRKDVESAGAHSNFWVERSMISAPIFTLVGSSAKITDSDGYSVDTSGERKKEVRYKTDPETGEIIYDPVTKEPIMEDVPQDERKDDGVIISTDVTFKNDEIYKIEFSDDSDIDIRSLEYSDVRYKMSYEQTQVNWGFFKKRKTYNVAVSVSKDSLYDTGNGDSGSKNHFYFQLIFKNGNSGYVMANQQITSDGFRSGYTETFTISTNQNYGELKGIRIIPEDVTSDSEPFDKLQVDRVTVSEHNNGGCYISWIIDNIGWIEIDYSDELESVTPRGQRARSAAELSKLYKVSYKEKDVKLACEISCEPWIGEFDQFIGTMRMEVTYTSSKDDKQYAQTFDAVQCMADYMKVNVKSVETETDPSKQIVAAEGLGTVSDSKWMFRPYHTDRLMLPAIPDLKSIDSISFYGQNLGEHAAKWIIKNISILQVVEDGAVQLTASNELYRNMSYRRVCNNTNDGTLEASFAIGGEGAIEDIPLSKNEIIWNADDSWATPVTRLPDSTDDELNIYVYPVAGTTKGNQADVNISLKYDIPFSQYKMVSSKRLTLTTDARGREVYVAKNIPAADFISTKEFIVYCVSNNVAFDHALIQHLREGTVMGNYTYNLLGATAVRGASGFISTDQGSYDLTEEKITIGLGAGTKEKILQSENTDIAVSFIYTSTLDDIDTKYYSPYVYITDQGYKKTAEGTFIELEYDVPFVKEIVGYNIAGYGTIEALVTGMASAVYDVAPEDRQLNVASGKMQTMKRTKSSFACNNETFALTDRLSSKGVTSKEPYGKNSVTPVELTFDTVGSSATKESKTRSSVKFVCHYIDSEGNKRDDLIFEDITSYIQNDTQQFYKDQSQTVKFFAPQMGEDLIINSIDVVPYNTNIDTDVNVADTIADNKDDKPLDQTLAEETGDGNTANTTSPETVDLADKIIDSRAAYWEVSDAHCDFGFGANTFDAHINKKFDGLDNGGVMRLLDVTIRTTYAKNNEQAQTVQDHNAQVLAESEDKIQGTVILGPPKVKGFTVKAYELIGDAEKDVSEDTVKIEDMYYTFSIPKYTVPNGTQGEVKKYKLEIYPNDAPDLIDTILVNVAPKEIAVKLTTNVSVNNLTGTTVQNNLAQIFASQGDKVLGTVLVEGSDKGYDVKVYKVGDGADNPDTEVTAATTTKDSYNFTFNVPADGAETNTLYRIVVSSVEEPSVKDTIMVTVAGVTPASTPTPPAPGGGGGTTP